MKLRWIVVAVVIVINLAYLVYNFGWIDQAFEPKATVAISIENAPQDITSTILSGKIWIDGQHWPRDTPSSDGMWSLTILTKHVLKIEYYGTNAEIMWGGIWTFRLPYVPSAGHFFTLHIDWVYRGVTITENG